LASCNRQFAAVHVRECVNIRLDASYSMTHQSCGQCSQQ